jgi:DNA polymerase II large subunit
MAACDGDEDAICREVPKDVELGMNSDNTTVPRIQTLDEELSCLIGYYTAEGFTRQRADQRVDGEHNGSNHTDIANVETEARDFIKTVFKEKFNKDELYTGNERRITASGNLTRFFFKNILDSGRLAPTKEIPDIVEQSSRKIIGAYFGGYISGDGSSVSDNLKMHTTSEKLRDDIIRVLGQMGYETSVRERPPEPLKNRFPDYYPDEYKGMSLPLWVVSVKEAKRFAKEFGVFLNRKEDLSSKDYDMTKVIDVSYQKSKVKNTYNLTVDKTHKLEVESLYLRNCDGDEDSVMLLMDGLVNFSRKYLPSQRGKNMMDAPIVMSTVLNPEEIDDEAHNVDIVEEYPLEFYKMTMHALDPDDAEIEIAEDDLENPTGFKSSIPTTDINAGPENTAYKSMDGMEDATDTQMDLAVKTRGVDESTVASMVVEKHCFPDIIGNLTAFARQEYQCAAGHMHRRAPASGKCTARDWCDASVRLTVYEGMVDKYVDAAQGLADDYELDDYTKQRLEELDERIESVFKDDKSEQTSIEDFLG